MQKRVKMGYVTLLSSENYLKAVLVLAYSLQVVKSQYPLVVMTTEDMKNEKMTNKEIINILCSVPNIIHVTAPNLKYCDEIQKEWKNHNVLNTASKIQIFSLRDWDKLIYIDADTIVISNIDNLFEEYPDGSMIKYNTDPYGFTGLFILEPRNHFEVDFYLYLLQNVKCFDGDILGKIWFVVNKDKRYQIPEDYLWDRRKNYTIPENVKVIHYTGDFKPWLENNYYEDDESINLYQFILKKIEELYF